MALAAVAILWGSSASAGAAPRSGALWLERYSGTPSSVKAGPDGSAVFVTGVSTGIDTGAADYATASYDAATGAQRWARRYNGPANGYDYAASMALSPDGLKVFVTGTSDDVDGHTDFATVAYDATTGAAVWGVRFGTPDGDASSASVAVSPDGTTVFVTGYGGPYISSDYVTIAYDAATGARQWVTRYDGPVHGSDGATSVAVSPDGSKVFVTGQSVGLDHIFHLATVAYDASTGAGLWVGRYDPAYLPGYAASVAVSPDGSKVFVTDSNMGKSGSHDYDTVAYDAASGARMWVSRYPAPADGDAPPPSLAVSPDGSKVFVAGARFGMSGSLEYTTIAYDAASGGTPVWISHYAGPSDGNDIATSLAVAPDGSMVVVTGHSYEGNESYDDYATVAYDPSTGREMWVKRYNGPGSAYDIAISVAVSPDSSKVFVTGSDTGTSGGSYWATLAYGR